MKKILLSIVCLCLVHWLSAQTYLISTMPSSVSTCFGTFYDSGGSTGNYNNNETFIKTFCSSTPGSQISFHFTSFNTESYDHLIIYDGPTTAGNILINASGLNPGTIVNHTFTSSNGCLTFKWTSDVSTYKAGWVANISCTFPCQPYTVKIVNPSTPFVTGGDSIIHICQNTPLTLHAVGTYPASGGQYVQSDATTNFIWIFGDTNIPATVSGIGMTSLTHTWPEGAYYVTLKAKDVNNCANSNLARVMVIVSTTPAFQGTNVTPDTVCLGSTVTLEGNHLQSQSWTTVVDTMTSGTTALYDGVGQPYDSPITNNLFTPGQTLTNTNDLQSVCLNMEHSYPGDLTIQLFCPSGQHVDLLLYSDGLNSAFFGEPIDDDANTNPGIGYRYCWTPTANQTMAQAYAINQTYTFTDLAGTTYTNHQHIIPGNYIPQGPNGFSALQGCMLNGSWVIHAIDNLSSDNGYIFNWTLNFNPAIIPPQFSFTNSYDSTTFSWAGPNIISQNNGLGSATPQTLGSNHYIFNVTDNFGCAYDTSFTVYVAPAGPCCGMHAPKAGRDTSLCGSSYLLNAVFHSQNTGSWSLLSGPGTVVFNNPNSYQTLVTVSNYGTYYFLRTEEFAISSICIFSDTVKITFNEPADPAFSSTAINCAGNSSTITFTGTLPTGTACNWNFDGAQILSGTGNGPFVVKWSIPGLHTVSLIANLAGCVSSTNHSINVPTPLQYTVTKTDNTCFNVCDGNAIFTVSGGTPPYSYMSASGTNILTNLCSGSQSVKIIDHNGCVSFATATIVSPTEITNFPDIQQVLCNGSNTGSITTNIFGGTLPYTYQWSNGSNGDNISGVTSGQYGVTVYDVNHCLFTDSFIVSEPAPIILGISTLNSHCGLSDGSASLNITGGIAPYVIDWSDTIFVNQDTITALSAGYYNVNVYDNNNCVQTGTALINDVNAPQMTVINNPVSCYGNNDGNADVSITSGTSPFVIAWSNGETNSLISNLHAGHYDVVVTDSAGCTATSSVDVMEPTQIAGNVTVENISCPGEQDGIAIIHPIGGTSPYQITDSYNNPITDTLFNLDIGSHYFYIMDSHNCLLISSFTVSQPDMLYITTNTKDVSCYNGNDGYAFLTVTGGVPPYTYIWSDGNTGSSVLNLSYGMYPFTVTDHNNCMEQYYAFINDPLDITILHSVTNASSAATADGAIHLSVSGGNSPYVYAWSNNEASESIMNLLPGSYSVTVIDNLGCTKTETFTVDFTNKISSFEKIISEIVVYPNPTTGIISIAAAENSQIDIFETSGKCVYKTEKFNSEPIDLTSLSSGVYFVRIINADKVNFVKIILK